jgi:hypothetical protein
MSTIIPQAETDETGYFRIDIPSWWFGKFAVAAKKEDEDYPDMSKQFYSDGKFETITLTSGHPAETVIIRLGPKAGVLVGTVADAASNAPLSPCIEFRRASEPNNFLSASGPGTVDQSAATPVKLGPGERKTVDIRLEPDAEVKTGCPKPINSR